MRGIINLLLIDFIFKAKPACITAETKDHIVWPTPSPEFELDAVTILERIREDEMENEGEQPSPTPDILSGLRETGYDCSYVLFMLVSIIFPVFQ